HEEIYLFKCDDVIRKIFDWLRVPDRICARFLKDIFLSVLFTFNGYFSTSFKSDVRKEVLHFSVGSVGHSKGSEKFEVIKKYIEKEVTQDLFIRNSYGIYEGLLLQNFIYF
ncbi:unnamed protein product, partial [Larinioides sclopetarius]